jgi:serine acetyltransferase
MIDEVSYNLKCIREYNAFKKMIINDYPYEIGIDNDFFAPIFKKIYNELLVQHSHVNNKYYSDAHGGIISTSFLDHYLILCFRVANYLYKLNVSLELAEAIYYSSRIRTSTDLFFTAEMGDYFIPVHSLGAVIDSRAKYGQLVKIYNGVHIGPYDILKLPPEQWKHPEIGNGVTLLANSGVFGNSIIGDNVVVAGRAVIINEIIPNNCIVIGQSPRLNVIPNTENNFNMLYPQYRGKNINVIEE